MSLIKNKIRGFYIHVAIPHREKDTHELLGSYTIDNVLENWTF